MHVAAAALYDSMKTICREDDPGHSCCAGFSTVVIAGTNTPSCWLRHNRKRDVDIMVYLVWAFIVWNWCASTERAAESTAYSRTQRRHAAAASR